MGKKVNLICIYKAAHKKYGKKTLHYVNANRIIMGYNLNVALVNLA